MKIDSAQAQESWECFGIDVPVTVETDGSPTPAPPGWRRRDWVMRDAALLGMEATPSLPCAAAVELDIVR